MRAVRTVADQKMHAESGAFSFYADPPEGEIRLSQFDSLVRLRLKLLQVIDRKASALGETRMDAFAEQEGANVIAMIPPIFRESPEDEVTSHFISRLAFARSSEFTEWFIKQEELLFFCKLKLAGPEGINQVLKSTGLLKIIRETISESHPDFDLIKKGSPETFNFFFLIHFTDCPPSLIARRAVVIKKGFAYLPDKEMPALLARKYKEHLISAMNIASGDKSSFMSDERISGIFKNIGPTAQTSKKNYGNLNGADRLNLSNFHVGFARSFPPCMRLPIEWMRDRKAHLKNVGRNQLTPFLRSAGLSLEDSLTWWKKEFSKDPSMDSDKFEKNYTYNIKWVYGKAGRMKVANPLSCSAVLANPFPAHDQMHGCPFK